MALWTPYADVALDLSKSSRSIVSPQAEYCSHDYPSPESPVYHFGYNHIPVPQLSPLSATSIGSYDRPYTPQLLSGGKIIDRSLTSQVSERSFSPRIPTLSPPISPQSLKRPYPIDDYLSDDPDFQAFERDALRAMAEKNGGVLLGNNPRMRRNVCSNGGSDDTYRMQRERNNFAAKQSRDRRKLREIHLALKVAYLKKEVAGLKAILAARVCNRCHQSCKC